MENTIRGIRVLMTPEVYVSKSAVTLSIDYRSLAPQSHLLKRIVLRFCETFQKKIIAIFLNIAGVIKEISQRTTQQRAATLKHNLLVAVTF